MENKKRHTLTLRCKTLQFHTIITAEPHNGHKSFVALSSAHKSLSLRPVLFNKQLFGASGTGYDHCGSTWTHDTGNDQRLLTIWAVVNLSKKLCISPESSQDECKSMKHHDIFMSICPATELWTWRLFHSDLPPFNHQLTDINKIPNLHFFPWSISLWRMPFHWDFKLQTKLMSKNPAKGMNLCTNPLKS